VERKSNRFSLHKKAFTTGFPVDKSFLQLPEHRFEMLLDSSPLFFIELNLN